MDAKARAELKERAASIDVVEFMDAHGILDRWRHMLGAKTNAEAGERACVVVCLLAAIAERAESELAAVREKVNAKYWEGIAKDNADMKAQLSKMDAWGEKIREEAAAVAEMEGDSLVGCMACRNCAAAIREMPLPKKVNE